LHTLAGYRFDAAVIGAAGISARWGITELTEEEPAIQRVALERTERVIVIADASKVGASPPIVVGPATLANTLVTDPSAPAEGLDPLRRLGLEVVVAERAAPAMLESVGGPMDAVTRLSTVPKPVIAMLHLPALPGRPQHDRAAGLAAAVESV